MAAGSLSYSPKGMMPLAPAPASKMTTQTIGVAARFQALAKASVWDIDPVPMLRQGPSPPDRRPRGGARGPDHRPGEDQLGPDKGSAPRTDDGPRPDRRRQRASRTRAKLIHHRGCASPLPSG